MGHLKYDYNKWLIIVTVITLSSIYCIRMKFAKKMYIEHYLKRDFKLVTRRREEGGYTK